MVKVNLIFHTFAKTTFSCFKIRCQIVININAFTPCQISSVHENGEKLLSKNTIDCYERYFVSCKVI